MSKLKQDLDHEVWKKIKADNLPKKKILVALSGGLDSVALLVILSKVHKNLAAAYCHHGPSGSKAQDKYRDQAAQFCEKICSQLQVKFYLVKNKKLTGSKPVARSEGDLRDLRYGMLLELLKKESMDLLALAHHSDDLLETRLLRLIRGTGAQGLVAMETLKAPFFRPLLDVSKKQLEAYLKAEKISFVPDPSNQDTDPLRNWLREDWLLRLEKKQKGSLRSLARSLETLANEIDNKKSTKDLLEESQEILPEGLSRPFYLSLSPLEQKRLLAQYLLSLGKKDFSQSQLEEICKRLDNSQKMITFKVAHSVWTVNAQQIKVAN